MTEAEGYAMLLEMVAILILMAIGMLIFFTVIFPLIFNAVLLFFSKSARRRKWEGYYDIGFMTKPMMTRTGHLYIMHLKEKGLDLITELRKSQKGESSEYFEDGMLVPLEELEPTEEELNSMVLFRFEVFMYYFLNWPVLPFYWIASQIKKKREKKNETHS